VAPSGIRLRVKVPLTIAVRQANGVLPLVPDQPEGARSLVHRLDAQATPLSHIRPVLITRPL